VATALGAPSAPLRAQGFGCAAPGSQSLNYGIGAGFGTFGIRFNPFDFGGNPYGVNSNIGWSTYGGLYSTEPSPTYQPSQVACDSVATNAILAVKKLFSGSTPTVSGAATGGSSSGGSSGSMRPSSLRALAGEVTVGFLDRGHFTTYHAFRWTEATGAVDLGTLDPANNAARTSMGTGTSADGSVVVGFSQIAGGQAEHAFRWTSASGMVDLGAPGGATRDSRALAVSAAGDVIVGEGVFADPNAFTGFRSGAFRWTQSGGFQSLGALQPGYFSMATDVTPDGSVIVGQGGIEVRVGQTSTNGSRAFRWTSTTGLEPIGPLPGQHGAIATSVSDNGKVVVGNSNVGGSPAYNLVLGHGLGTAFRWTESGGIQDLRQLLVTAGLDLTGIQLVSATAVSPDGQWIIGKAITPTTPAGETRPFLAKFCDAAIAGACLPLVAPAATFQLTTANATAVSVAAGNSATSTITITPANGFNQAVTFACSGLPAESSCAFAPTSLTPNGTAAASTTLTISTSAPRRGMALPGLPPGAWLSLALVIAGLLLMRRGVVYRARAGWIRPVAAGVVVIAVAGSCGGGGDGGTDPPPPPVLIGGTPAGTFPVTVTASAGTGAGALSRTLTITLTVTR
jgi:probable HAF family extracellular repeat protein